eukprot:scaffold24554_cov90-Isochrysis_galbana.AAC.1
MAPNPTGASRRARRRGWRCRGSGGARPSSPAAPCRTGPAPAPSPHPAEPGRAARQPGTRPRRRRRGRPPERRRTGRARQHAAAPARSVRKVTAPTPPRRGRCTGAMNASWTGRWRREAGWGVLGARPEHIIYLGAGQGP